MLKVLQINSTLNWGSTGKIAEEIGCLIIKEGWESYIAYGRYSNNSKSVVLKIGNYFDILIHLISSRIFDNHGLMSIKATSSFIKMIKLIRPDIIHIHNIHGYYINYEKLFAYINKENIPVVWTLHDCWPITGHCAHFVTVGCDKYMYGCGSCVAKYRYPKSLIFDNSEKNYLNKKRSFTSVQKLHLVSVSKWLKNVVQKSFFKDNSISVIYNGIDLSVFYPRNKRSSSGFCIIAVANVWGKEKGLEDIIALSKMLAEDEYILLVGLDPKKYCLPFNIKAIKRIDNQFELASLYSDADVVISLSYAETFGLSILEGLACGTPAIVYDNTAQSELVNSMVGYKVNTGNIGGVYTAIKQIRLKGREYFTTTCVEYAKSFDRNKTYREYIQLYKDIINK